MASPPNNKPDTGSHPLQTSRYDRVSSWLIALLVAVGLVVLVMAVTWWQNNKDDDGTGGGGGGGKGIIETVLPAEILLTSDDHQLASLDDEAKEANEKAREEFKQRLQILEQASKTAGALDNGLSGKKGDGNEFEPDEKREKPKDSNDPALMGSRNWEILFDKTSLDTYAKQLDFFKIEIGVLLPDGRVAYVSNLSDAKPAVRYVKYPGKSEKRYYFTWRRGELQKADAELLTRAGIDASKGIVVKFLHPKAEDELAELERTTAAGSEGKRIRKTRFGIKRIDGGFAFFVLEQTYKD